MAERIEILVEYVGIERGAVQQVMRRADCPAGYAETRSRVWDLDGRPYVRCYDKKWYLSEDEARIAREARDRPYQPIMVVRPTACVDSV